MKALACLLLLSVGVASVLAETPAQRIDSLLDASFRKAGLKRNAPASDEVFLRRVSLDAIGRAPTLTEARAFLDSSEPNKRAKLIDALLANNTAYAMGWYNYWADVLRLQPRDDQRLYWNQYVHYVRAALETNRPYDEWVRELLSARGDLVDGKATFYQYRDLGMPLDNLAMSVRVFLGTRIECAQCHNHPFDKWKQMDFYRLAATPYRLLDIDRTQLPPANAVKPMVAANRTPLRNGLTNGLNELVNMLQHTHVEWSAEPLKLPHDYSYDDAKPFASVQPGVLFGPQPHFDGSAHDADAFAAWVTSAQNPRFALVVANRLWKRLFGLGLIEPHDELTDNSVASQPELMAYLTEHMIDVRFDLKAFLRTLLNTQTYQAQCRTEELVPGEASPFTGPQLRRLNAEQIWDSLVAMSSATPELINAPREAYYQRRLAFAHDQLRTLQSLPPERLYGCLERYANEVTARVDEMNALQAQGQKLIAEGNKEAAKKIGAKIGEMQSSMATKGLLAFLIETAKQGKDKEPAKPNALADDPVFALAQLHRAKVNPRQAVEEARRRSAEPILAVWKTAFENEAQLLNVAAAKREAFITDRSRHATEFLRAAEYPESASAALLRDLGQSDREVIENGNTDATIPQALNLLNNERVLTGLTQPTSALSLRLASLRSDEERIEAIFLAMLTRKPTAQDLSAWRVASDHAKLNTRDLIHALLNTRQLLFVQ